MCFLINKLDFSMLKEEKLEIRKLEEYFNRCF